ncbi:MAG TPA: hypothetical protein VF515_08695 [Candidatus Binatia bacterium]
MRTVKWNAFLSCLCGFAVALGGMAASARADVTTEKGASILIFPKVRVDSTFDTIIQISNTGNSMAHAHCFYVNASLVSLLTGQACENPSPTCVAQWQETDFDIWLTRQQPTHWLVSTGRSFEGITDLGSDSAGFAPGHVPPVRDFLGELKCIEVTDSGEPLTGNHLKGEATIKSLVDTAPAPGTFNPNQTAIGDVAKYNAVGILGKPDASPSNPLLLDGTNYDACPAKLILNHFASGAEDPVVVGLVDRGGVLPSGSTSSNFTELTLVPCSEDFENQLPTGVTVQFLVFNEFEQRFSASTTVACYFNLEIARIDTQFSATAVDSSVFGRAVLGTDFAQTEITPVVQLNGFTGGLVGVAERIVTVQVAGEFSTTVTAARAAYNLHSEGSLIPATGPDKITMPAL